MYSNKVPQVNDIVFVKLSNKKHSEFGNYVNLVEYNNLEGLVLCTEITKYKSNLKSVVKQDEIFPVIVLDIQNNNNILSIDLSYSKIKSNHKELLKNCYNFQNKIYNFIKNISTELNLTDDIYNIILSNNISADSYIESINRDCNLLKEKYENILKNPECIFDNSNISEDIKNNICNYIQSKIKIKPYVVEKDFKLTVFDNQSLIKLKDILNKIKNINNNYEISCKSSPIYQIRISDNCLDKIKNIFETLENDITIITNDYNCSFNFVSELSIIREIEIIYE
jgi:translation initiation factor 2 subunit 1